MTENESSQSKKWWHATLVISAQDTGAIESTLTTVDIDPSGNPIVDINISPNIFAFATNSLTPTVPVTIPVPSFDSLFSPGVFLFRPDSDFLEASIVDINTYQDAVNSNSRKNFEFTIRAGYDIYDNTCTATSPNTLDYVPYVTINDNVSSNIFRYPQLTKYDKIGCCQVEISLVGANIPLQEGSGNPTRIWYLTFDSSISKYRLFSYDFALLSNALVDRGIIDTSAATSGVLLYDISWLPDNTLIVLASDGIRQLLIGSATTTAKLGHIIPITNISNYASTSVSVKPCFEYNYHGNNLFIFGASVDKDGNFLPTIFKLAYSTSSFRITNTTIVYSLPSNIGDFAFPDENTSYFNSSGDLYKLDLKPSNFGQLTPVSSGQPIAGMQTINFAANPDLIVGGNILYVANSVGQQFRVDPLTGTPSIVSGAVITPGSVLGSTTSLIGEDQRVIPFPFFIGKAPWMFMVDVSASMAGPRITRVKSALISFINTYVRYGDKVSILWFKDSSGLINKEMRTYADVNEVINFINTNFVTSSESSNFCSSLTNLNMLNVNNLILFSDGIFTDCGETTEEWQANITDTIDLIKNQNPQVVFRVVGVSAIDTSKLNFIATQSGGTYNNWNG